MDQLRPVLNTPIQNNIPPVFETTAYINPPSTTKTVDLENLEEPSSKLKINLFENDISTDFLKNKTADAKPEADNRNTTYINPGPVQNNTSGFSTGQLVKSKDDLRGGVRSALLVVDYGLSFLAMKISGDVSQSRYTADTSQKKLLEDVLVEYLYIKQQAMPLWLTLTFAIAGSYGIILLGAFKEGKAKKERVSAIAKNNNSLPPLPTPLAPTIFPPQNNFISKEDMKKYTDIKPPVKVPVEAPVMEQAYKVFNDGTTAPIKTYYPYDPDPNLIAENPTEVRTLVAKGIYPMYRRNGKGVAVKVKYSVDGTPLIAGKQSKVYRRK